MMYKKSICIIATIIITLLNYNLSYANNNTNTLIIYENEQNTTYKENTVEYLEELLYKFSKNVEKINVDEYNKVEIGKFDYVFIVNIENDIDNSNIIKDLSKYNGNIYWIGNKIENLLEYENKYSIEYDGKNNNINRIIYKDNTNLLSNYKNFNIVNLKNNDVEILATMSDGYNYYPYIIKDKKLYYISNYRINSNYIFEDSLNDFYKVKSFNEPSIFLIIDGVEKIKDKNKLNEIGKYLNSKNIPLIVTIKTINKNSIETLRYFEEIGASFILDIGDNDNLDIETLINEKIINDIRILVQNEIYPLGLNISSENINKEKYKIIKKYFSTAIICNKTLPYKINESKYFNTLMFENLGTLKIENDYSIDQIKEKIEKLSVVRDYTAGLRFSSDIDIKHLEQVIDYIREKDISFLDLKNNNNYVKIKDISIFSSDDEIQVSYDKDIDIYKDKDKDKNEGYNKIESRMEKINNFIVLSISIILVIFTLIFIVFRVINRNKFKRR